MLSCVDYETFFFDARIELFLDVFYVYANVNYKLEHFKERKCLL